MQGGGSGTEGRGQGIRQRRVFRQDRLQAGNPRLIQFHRKGSQELLIRHLSSLLSAVLASSRAGVISYFLKYSKDGFCHEYLC